MSTSFTEWLTVRSARRRRKSLSVHTLRQKAYCLATVSERLHDLLGIQNQDEAVANALCNRETVETLLDSLAVTHAAGSVRNICYALRDFEAYAKACGWACTFALSPDDVPPSQPQGHIDCFTPDELRALDIASRMKGLRWHLFIMTLIHTGRRIGDVLNFTYADVRLDDVVPHVVVPTSKGSNQAQYAPLNAALVALYTPANIAELRNSPPRVPTTHDPDVYLFPWTYTNARSNWKKMLDAVGIEYRNPHQLRHTKATQMIVAGAPIVGVSRLLGHSSVSTTDRYYVHLNALHYASLLD